MKRTRPVQNQMTPMRGEGFARIAPGKAHRALTGLLALACLLSGCTSGNKTPSEDTRVVLPEPPVEETRQILGDQSAAHSEEVALYYFSGDLSELSTVTRGIRLAGGESLIERTLSELLDPGVSGSDFVSLSNADTYLRGEETACGIVTVDLSLEAGVTQSDQAYLLLVTALSNTLLGLDGVEAVNVLIGGRSNALRRLPIGAITAHVDSTTALYAQFQSEEERLYQEGSGTLSRNVVLYYPSIDGRYLIPETRSLDFTSDDYASVILEALKAGPQKNACAFSAIPKNMELMTGAPKLRVTEDGERILTLDFSSVLSNYLAFSGIEPWQLYGSVVLSLSSFVPELDALCISVDGVPVTDCTLPDAVLHPQDGQMRRSDFSACIGGSAAFYLQNAEGTLERVEYAMKRKTALSPKGVLETMIALRPAAASGLASPFPEGIQPEDVLGVDVESAVACVNLSAHFYSACQTLDARRERNLIYAIVNTLCASERIGAVRFLVEGMPIDTLCGGVYLKSPLLPDPGMAATAASPEPGATATAEAAP